MPVASFVAIPAGGIEPASVSSGTACVYSANVDTTASRGRDEQQRLLRLGRPELACTRWTATPSTGREPPLHDLRVLDGRDITQDPGARGCGQAGGVWFMFLIRNALRERAGQRLRCPVPRDPVHPDGDRTDRGIDRVGHRDHRLQDLGGVHPCGAPCVIRSPRRRRMMARAGSTVPGTAHSTQAM